MGKITIIDLGWKLTQGINYYQGNHVCDYIVLSWKVFFLNKHLVLFSLLWAPG